MVSSSTWWNIIQKSTQETLLISFRYEQGKSIKGTNDNNINTHKVITELSKRKAWGKSIWLFHAKAENIP